MTRHALLTIGILLTLGAVDGQAQTTLAAERVRLNAGPCTIDSVNGTPDKVRLVDCPTVTTSSATNLTLQPTGDLVLDPTGADVLPGTANTVNIGSLTNKFLTGNFAEIIAGTLVAQNSIATIGGRVLFIPTTTLTSDVTTGATSITVKHNQMANGDRVYLEANGAVEFMAITSAPSGAGPYTYTVTRNLDGSGANAWSAGDAVANTGTTGAGFIDGYATAGVLSGNGPTLAGNVRTGTTYNQIATRWACGNLNGLYGYGATTFGCGFGDASGTNVTVDASNGFRVRAGTTDKFKADTSGNLSILGDLSVGTSGVIRSGATGFSTGTGYWLDFNGGTPRFRIGDPAGGRVSWDGSTLTVAGDGSGVTNINGSNIQTGTVSAAKLTVGTGRNLVRNSDCAASTTDWNFLTDAAGTQTSGFGASGANLQNTGDNTCWFSQSGTPASTKISYAYSPLYSVVAGNKYEASAYLGVLRTGNTYAFIRFYQADGTTITGDANGNVCTTASAGGVSLSGYCRSGVVGTAPALTTLARVFILTIHNGSGAAPVVYFVHTYFGEALANQTELTPWGPAGLTEIVGGLIKTGTITASNIAANTITASQIAGGTITANEIAASTITGAKIAAGTITASNLSVSTLSAITANLGTVTAGSINIGSGNFIVDSGGNLSAYNLLADRGLRVQGGTSYTATFDVLVRLQGQVTPGSPTPIASGSAFLCADAAGFVYACY